MNKKYVLKRLGVAGVVTYMVFTLTFVLIQLLPGGPEDYLMAQAAMNANISPENIEMSSTLQGSVLEQYIQYLSNIVQGNLGTSTWYNEPVARLIGEGLPWTVFVMAHATFFIYAIGISLGAMMAYKEGSKFDTITSTVATFLNSIPYYVAAIVLLFLFGFVLGWFPTEGKVSPYADPGANLEFIGSAYYHAVLPITSFVVTAFGFRALQMRSNSVSILGSNYVRVANLRGLRERYIALRYVAPNAVLPMYTGIMIWLGLVFGGSVVLETIFTYTGLGWYLYQGLITRDVPLMMGSFMLISVAVIVGLTIADLTYGLVDPRAAADDEDGGGGGVTIEQLARGSVVFFARLKNSLYDRVTGNERESEWDVTTDIEEDSQFNVTSDRSLTRKERYKQAFDEYVVASVRLILSDWRAVVGLTVLFGYVLVATIGTWIVPEPTTNMGPRYLQPFVDWSLPLGTDNTGRSLLSSVVHATPAILKMILSGALIGAAIATVVGLMAGYFGGIIERVLTGITDTLLAIPGLPLVMVLAVVIEPESPYTVGLLLVVNAWAGTARQVHSETLSIRKESYIEASRAMMVPRRTILIKEVLPNIAPFVFIKVVQMGRGVIFAAVALYFLGILPFTNATYNWGVTMNQAYEFGAMYSVETIHWLLVPMIAIVALTYAMVLLAQGMDQVFNPQVRVRHADTQIDEEDSESTPAATPADD